MRRHEPLPEERRIEMDNLEMVLNAVEAFERDWYSEHPDGKDVESN